MKTIREHWESLRNKKLGEWLMKHTKKGRLETKIGDLFFCLTQVESESHEKLLDDCYDQESWQPILDALPELREDEPVSVQPQQDQRRSEVVQLVAAILSGGAYVDRAMDWIVNSAIEVQNEIDKQLNGKDWSKSCTCVESSPGETWCCNLCGLPKDDKQLK